MKQPKNTDDALIPKEFMKKVWEESWTYVKTVVDIVREPILILDKDLRVMAANECFYYTFKVEPKDILPESTFFKGFEVEHNFQLIGHKVMILNARQVHFKQGSSFPPTIILAMEDVTDMMAVAENLAGHAKQFETKLNERTQRLEVQITDLSKELAELKKKS